MKAYLTLLRPEQYLKNLFIFAPVFFAGLVGHDNFLVKTAIAFVLFSLAASAVYIFNDYHDIKEDKQHPIKKLRPLASGKIKTKTALSLMFILFGFSIIGAYFLSHHFLSILLIYIALNIFYSLKLKHISILDIVIIAIGFVLRVFAGAAVIGIGVSMWIVLMTFLLALFLAIAKRRDDVLLANSGVKVRKNIDGYSVEFINAAMVIMSSVVIVSYIFYTISEEVEKRLHTHNLYLTVIFVIIGILRYMQITMIENNSGNPSKLLLKDRFLQLTILGWILVFGWFLYK